MGHAFPFFFLHIPKTAGSSWNEVLRSAYGADHFVEHIEHHLPALLDGAQGTQKKNCVSGHVPLNNWRGYPGQGAYARMSILRDPWRRLVSHINWIDRFNHDHPFAGHGKDVAQLRHVAGLIAETDFESRASLTMFLSRLHDAGHFFTFDNLQTRMLYVGPENHRFCPVSPSLLRAANAEMARFEALGVCEDLDGFQSDFLGFLGLPSQGSAPRVNTARIDRVRPDMHVARDVLHSLIAFDSALYRRARALIDERRALFGSAILPRDIKHSLAG